MGLAPHKATLYYGNEMVIMSGHETLMTVSD